LVRSLGGRAVEKPINWLPPPKEVGPSSDGAKSIVGNPKVAPEKSKIDDLMGVDLFAEEEAPPTSLPIGGSASEGKPPAAPDGVPRQAHPKAKRQKKVPSPDSALKGGEPPAVTRTAESNPSSEPAHRYSVIGATAYDTENKLTWQRTAPNEDFSWEEAKTYCASAAVTNLLGGRGWRLPTRPELETLVVSGRTPTIDETVFPRTRSSRFWFWSSSPVAGLSSTAWVVGFLNGEASSNLMLHTDHVRCVR
jgi:hypothetical protein